MIILCLRRYFRYRLSYRDLVEMMAERGLYLAHTTIMRWVNRYGPELEKRIKPQLKQTNGSWRVDETCIKIGKIWNYHYRAVDKDGYTVDFLLRAKPDRKAPKD